MVFSIFHFLKHYPLKSNGQLVDDSKGKADILINQFKSVFTREEKQNTAQATGPGL
jgi:hypothetical protein